MLVLGSYSRMSCVRLQLLGVGTNHVRKVRGKDGEEEQRIMVRMYEISGKTEGIRLLVGVGVGMG